MFINKTLHNNNHHEYNTYWKNKSSYITNLNVIEF